MTIIIFVIVILVLVVAHEFGHFIVARICGVKVDEFGFGYPPRALKLGIWKGTLFTLNWLPFGGFVKIFGDEAEQIGSKEDETAHIDIVGRFSDKPLWKRLSILVAGIFANMILAIVLFIIAFNIGFFPATPIKVAGVVSDDHVIVTNVAKGSAADTAGISLNDAIIKLSAGRDSINPITSEDTVSFIKAHPTSQIIFEIERNGNKKEITATPLASKDGGSPQVGITLMQGSFTRLPFWKSIYISAIYTIQQFGEILSSFFLLFGGLFVGNTALLSQVSGPVGIASIASVTYSLGFGTFLAFVAFISINLAFINLLPFPALDGGRFVMELFTFGGKSRIPKRVAMIINQIGFLLLIVLMLLVTYHDIFHHAG